MNCEQCGAPIDDPRKGGQRKRFCNSACRGRWHRGGKRAGAEPEAPPAAPSSAGSEEATLRDLYERLRREVKAHGAMVEAPNGGLRLNPAVGELRRVTVELARMAERRMAGWVPPAVPEEAPGEPDELRAMMLRAVPDEPAGA